MLRFECDYGEGAAPAVLELMQKTNFDQTPGYGEDSYCAAAADKIRALCDAPDAAVHFFVGATQANLTVIDAALKPWQGVLCADSGHIHVHETGSIEACGHKVLCIPHENGKLRAEAVAELCRAHYADASFEHMVQPGAVYVSSPSELGTIYSRAELAALLPHEQLIYFGDTGRVPYGSRSPETILQYARQDVAFLLSKNVKCIMAACGTVSSTYPAAEAAQLPVPYLGVVDAAAREAAFVTRNRRIGVIGTAATIRSRSYEKLLRQLVPGVEITAQACPLFVPLVEAGYVDHSEESRQQVTKLVIAQYLTEVREAGVDTLILGCTHYPLLKTMIGEFMGQSVTLVDPAKTAAHHLEQMLSERGLRAAQEHEGQAHFYVSDVPDSFVQTADLFLGEYKGGPVDQIAIDKY